MTDLTIHNPGARQALANFYERHQTGPDLATWPPDVIGIVRAVCELWCLRPPATKKSKAYWIQQARELQDAVGEFGLTCLEAYRVDFERHMLEHHGLAPHPVEGPGSLIKMVRDKARQMRERQQVAVPEPAPVVHGPTFQNYLDEHNLNGLPPAEKMELCEKWHEGELREEIGRC